MRLLAKQTIVVSIAADPEPDEPVRRVDREGSVVSADSRGPEPPHFLEVKRRMPWILLDPRVGLIGKVPHFGRQGPIQCPEVGRRVVNQRGVVLPTA